MKDRIDAPHRPQLDAILHGLFVMARYRDESESERALIAHGVPDTLAWMLTAFLPSAAARVVMQGKVGFSDTYFWRNARTNRAVERRYDQTSLFSAAVAILGALYESKAAAAEVYEVACSSAEMNGVNNLLRKGGKLENVRFTSMVHSTYEPVDGTDLDQLMAARPPPASAQSPPARPAAPAKPRWKFW